MLRERIGAALKQATLDQDKRKTSTLRLVNAAILDRDIAARGAGKDPVDDEDVTAILVKMIRQRLDSAKAYEEGNRLDLAEQEREEITIIQEFLPRQLDDDQMRSVCSELIKETGAHGLRDIGKCMKTLKSRYRGQMDFGKASTVVKGLLT
ncbi:MAG: GatB/YqeY domain-containing protein [Hyphomicrobiales bacterium]|nr:GatB/YqeY domain-containing protein [Hyphomicrobiales bacterium]